jgi:putative DNA primase/helicase
MPTNAFVIRTEKVGDQHVPKKFSTWTAIAVAAIGRAPETWEDRSIEIRMKRKPAGRKVERLNRRNPKALAKAQELTQKIARWASDHKKTLAAAIPKLPDGLDDRARDNWDCLLAIADEAGETWSEKARKAALDLSEGRSKSAGWGEQLLADIRQIFKNWNADRISSAELCEDLLKLELGPWKTYGRARKPITQIQIARLLGHFGIVPGSIWLPDGKTTAKGYKLEQFKDVFDSYPAPPEPPPEPPSKPTQPPDHPDSSRQDVRSTGAVRRNDDFRSVRPPPPDVSKSDISAYGEKRPDDLTGQNAGSERASIKTGSDDAPDEATYAPGRNGTGPSSTDISSGITEAMKVALHELGYSDQDIARLTPEQAHEYIRDQLEVFDDEES